MKRILIAMLSICTLFFCACSDGNGNATKRYDYEIPDIIKADAMIDVAALQAKQPVATKITAVDNIDGYLIEVAPYSEDKITKSFFWVGKPSGEPPKGGWPAVLLIHGGGGNAFSDWVEFWNKQGYVALSIDIGGQMFDATGNLTKNGEFYCDGSWGSVSCGTNKEAFQKSWTYMNIAACIAANNYLRALPYVNQDKIVATGISWGGYTTCILSGLDKRFRAFAPVYGCGSMHTDSWGLSNAGIVGLSEEQKTAWSKAYDPTSYLPYATRPMLFVSGVTDHAFSAVSHKKSTSLVPGKTFFAYAAKLEHGHYYNLTPCVGEFFDHVLNDTQPKVDLLSAEYADGKMIVNVEADAVGCLIYTLSTDPDSHNWTWQRQSAVNLQKGKNELTVPNGTTACFIEGYGEDADFASASTDLFFPNGYGNFH